ncbi:MAG: hypothetical protein QW189_08395 [Thermofilaceae archaeon]
MGELGVLEHGQGLRRGTETGARILTLFLTRDASTFVRENYERVRKQIGVVQDVYVVSASPVPVENNIVVPVPQSFPLPIRIGVSINKALERIGTRGYTHIFKVDSDVKLPPDYLANLLSKGKPVAGRGGALLISMGFLRKILGGKYPVNYCDDGYVAAVSVAHGWWPPEYDGESHPLYPVIHQHLREYAYGYEYYKWGLPLSLFILIAPVLLATGQRDLRSLMCNIAGYLSALLRGEKRYPWWRSYAHYRVKHFVQRAARAFVKIAR